MFAEYRRPESKSMLVAVFLSLLQVLLARVTRYHRPTQC